MKKGFSRMWSKVTAMLLVICLTIGLLPMAAFAEENEPAKKYVSLGDSMTNGYGLTGYDSLGNNGYLEVAEKAYPSKVASNYGWELTQLATSAMRVEDLNYILGGNFAGDDWTTEELMENDDRWGGKGDVASTFQTAVKEADVISMAAGNANFGVFLLGRITNALGLFGSAEDDAWINFENALSTLDAETQATVMSMYNEVLNYAKAQLPAELAEPLTKAVGYTLVSFILNYNGALDRIVELNPDAEIIIVGLMNTMSGYVLNFEYEGETYTVDMEQILNLLIQPMNAYLAVLPAAKQAMGEYADAKIYYADVDSIAVMSESYRDLYKENDGENTIRDRFVKGIGSFVGDLLPGYGLNELELTDVLTYEANSLAYAQGNPDKAKSVAIYLGLEEAVLQALEEENLTISLDDIMNSESENAEVFLSNLLAEVLPENMEQAVMEAAVNEYFDVTAKVIKNLTGITVSDKTSLLESDVLDPVMYPGVQAAVMLEVLPLYLVDTLCGNDLVLALLNLYGRLKMGDGLSAHPSAIGHEQLTAAIIKTYDEKHTVQDDIKETVEIALDELYAILEEYGPEVAAQVWAELEEAGYVEYVDTAIADLQTALTERYNNYVEVVIPALNSSVEELNEQAETLKAELEDLKAELEAKKAELETATGVAAAELEAAIAELEETVATVEAAIAAVENNISDLEKMAEELNQAVVELDTQLAELAEAAEDLGVSVEALLAVLKDADGSTVEAIVSAYDAARDTVITSAEMLEKAMAATDTLVNDIGEMATILNEKVVGLYEMILADLEEAYNNLTPEQKEAIAAVMAELEKAKAAVMAELEKALAELEAEYGPQIEAKKQELAALKEQIEAEIAAKYEEAKAEIEAKIAELTQQAEELKAQLENASEELKAEIEAEIAAIEAQIAALQGDLDAAVENIRAEVEAAYEEAVQELEAAIAALEEEYNKAVEELTAAADEAIRELVAEADKKLAELDELGEEISAVIGDIYTQVQEEIAAVNNSIKDLLTGASDNADELMEAIESLADETVVAIEEKVNELIETVEEAFEAATTADLTIDDDFKYVAIGDASAVSESYVDKLEAALNAEAAENGVDEIEVVNYAKAGNTVAAERADLSDVSEADLITVGFSNVTFLSNAMQGKVTMDWASTVGEENVQYVDQIMAEIEAKIAENGLNAELTAYASGLIEAYAYSAVEYAVELPELINEIHAANPDALIIIVGMYNPMEGVTIVLDENTTLNIGEYVDYLVEAVGIHNTAYAMLTGNAIYVEAADVETTNTDTELTVTELMTMAMNQFEALYPSAIGDDYIAAQIADALNITYVKAEVPGLLGDANSDGIVDSYDATLIMKYDVGMIGAEDLDLSVCDVDGDGIVDSYDATLIQKYDVGMIEKFPAEV